MLMLQSFELLHAFNCSVPAAWIQGLSFGACFRSIASFLTHTFQDLGLSAFTVHEMFEFDIAIWSTQLCLGEILLISFLRLRGLNRGNWRQQFRRFLAGTFRFVLKTTGTKLVTRSQRYSFRQTGFYHYTTDHCRSNKSETWMAGSTRWLYDREKWSHMTTVTSVSLGRSILVPSLTKHRFAHDCSEWSWPVK